ncbi:hypothetical protein BJV77DRAFT_1152999 [Russula vinacea]|nr:hypothetical protein BJV77DRAFT_1152999 [Russula vinacea]
MSQTSPEAASHSNYQAIFDSALEVYKKKTGKDLASHPLLGSFETCHSPDAVLAAFSGTIGGVVSSAYPPVGVIFTGIGILLSAASAVGASRDLLLGLFERIENIFRRLEIYINVPRTSGMTDAIVKVMVEVLSILAIATKEINQRRAKTFLKKLVKKTKIEDALRRLEEVTLEEARMAAAESLKAVHGVGSDVRDTLKAVEDRMRGMEGVLQGVGDRYKVSIQNEEHERQDDKQCANRSIGGEKTGVQMPKDLDVVALDGLKTTHGIDDEVQRVHDTRECP